MRTDVKLGVVISMVVVLAAGGYFVFRGKGEPAVPVTATASKDAAAGKTAPAKPATTPAKPRQVATNKDPSKPTVSPTAAPPTNTPPRDNRTASKPADRPVVPSPVLTTANQPAVTPTNSGIAASPPVSAPLNNDPKPAPPVSPPAVTERAANATPTQPISAPATNLNSPAPAPTNTSLASGADLPVSTPPGLIEKPAASPATTNPISLAGKPMSSPQDTRSAAVDTHKVQPGDSLATLAQTYYGGAKYAKFLAESNPQIADPAKLTVGAMVKIPALPADVDARLAVAPPKTAKTPAATNAGGKRTYKVQAGDSFYRIAKDQLGNASRWKELYALNKSAVHGDPTQLQVGQTLVLPES